jgi:hypothetical protein
MAERELGGPARWRAREDAQLSLTVGEQGARWLVRRGGGGGGARGKANRKETRSLPGNGGSEVEDAGNGARRRSTGCARERKSARAKK